MAQITQEQFEGFLALLSQGAHQMEAAHEVGVTSTRMRWAIKRNVDWKERYDAAMFPHRQNAELRRMLGVR